MPNVVGGVEARKEHINVAVSVKVSEARVEGARRAEGVGARREGEARLCERDVIEDVAVVGRRRAVVDGHNREVDDAVSVGVGKRGA